MMLLQTAVLSVLFCSVYSFTIPAGFEKSEEHSGNNVEEREFGISAQLEKVNTHVGKGFDEPLVLYGDIAVPTGLQNADPCTARGCLWPKANDGNVYVPYKISNQYSRREKATIIEGLNSFAQSTCIRFTERTNRQEDFLDIQSHSGCYSYVGRIGRDQIVSLSRHGCVYKDIIQHELLHALGFNHEQTRSDRDNNVRIQLQNVIDGLEYNFDKVETNNLGTPYDYNSVMQYERYAFSKNFEPTIVPIPDPNVAIGEATEMSANDILRVNRLYCNGNSSTLDPEPVQRKHFH
ncbi:high choriolytic enzyme 1-like isoform X2 [Sebastes umbrosus]|uniref:high choriolytic enzyme 1-like isoform X1 n=1 Tax=Sebastes umbrosus TaxID=72105 RepID=UPI00189C85E8|nr:high choriolytic enzyme 1-like isoform X1 [Sebastes umbrosus]XP_037615703.1 high choriolytic enzyme 1-like isoform X2 [Sebastes umbrosus]